MCSKNAISTLLWNPCRLLFGFVDFYSCFLTKYDAAVRLSKLGLPRGFKLNWAHSFNIMQNFVSPNTWFFIHFWLCFVDFYYFVDFYSSWWLDQTTISDFYKVTALSKLPSCWPFSETILPDSVSRCQIARNREHRGMRIRGQIPK